MQSMFLSPRAAEKTAAAQPTAVVTSSPSAAYVASNHPTAFIASSLDDWGKPEESAK